MTDPRRVVVIGAVLAAGSMVGAYLLWRSGLPDPAKIAGYAVLAVVGLVGAGLTLRDRRR